MVETSMASSPSVGLDRNRASSASHWAAAGGGGDDSENVSTEDEDVPTTLLESTSSAVDTTAANTDSTASSPETSTTVLATTTVRAPPTTPPPTIPGFDDGTFLIGSDVQPGRYIATQLESCYWARLKDASGSLDAIIANDNATGQAIVDIAPTDALFESSGCGRWSCISARVTSQLIR